MEKKPNTTKDTSVSKTGPSQSKRRSVVSYNNLSPELLERVGLAGDEQFIQAMSNMLTKDYFQIFINLLQ